MYVCRYPANRWATSALSPQSQERLNSANNRPYWFQIEYTIYPNADLDRHGSRAGPVRSLPDGYRVNHPCWNPMAATDNALFLYSVSRLECTRPRLLRPASNQFLVRCGIVSVLRPLLVIPGLDVLVPDVLPLALLFLLACSPSEVDRECPYPPVVVVPDLVHQVVIAPARMFSGAIPPARTDPWQRRTSRRRRRQQRRGQAWCSSSGRRCWRGVLVPVQFGRCDRSVGDLLVESGGLQMRVVSDQPWS